MHEQSVTERWVRVLAGGECRRFAADVRPASAVLASVLFFIACASDGRDAAPSPTGQADVAGAGTGEAEPAGAEEGAASTEGGSASSGAAEALDPDRIENVPSAGQGGSAATPGAGTRALPAPSSGCGQAALLASGERSIEVEGVARTYVLDVPDGYDGTEPLPLVFAFHGATTSGALFRSAFYGNLLSTMADAAILVHPDALGDPSAWNDDVDIAFFDALVAELGATACVDEARVFATGHSSGGFFTNALGCQRGDVLRAIAPVSGGGPFTFGGSGCRGEVAVWLAHAENDETVPFDSGVDSRDRWLGANGCSVAAEAVEPSPCVEYAGCGAGLPVRWCVYQDGHDWPAFGPEGIWGFFSSF